MVCQNFKKCLKPLIRESNDDYCFTHTCPLYRDMITKMQKDWAIKFEYKNEIEKCPYFSHHWRGTNLVISYCHETEN